MPLRQYGEICEDSDGEAEAEVAVAIRNPETPSQAEIAEHELCHLPFRSWCTHCQRGKAKMTLIEKAK
jgi:hypothetical protein